MNMVIYVILKSVEDIIYELDSWSKNHFVAKKYFEHFEQTHPDSILREYECDSYLDLIKKVGYDANISVTEFPDRELMTKTSYDSKLVMIYPGKLPIPPPLLVSTFIEHYRKLVIKHCNISKYINDMSIQNMLLRSMFFGADIDCVYGWRFLVFHGEFITNEIAFAEE